MTVTVDSSHILDHDKFMKKIDATIKQHSDADSDDVVEIVNELIDTLAHVREEDKIDFSRDDAMRKKIDRLFEKNPRAFGYEKCYSWDTQEERESFISALKEQFKIKPDTTEPTLKSPMPLEKLLMPSAVASENQSEILALAESFDAQEPVIENVRAPEIKSKKAEPPASPPAPKQSKNKWVFKDTNLGMAFIDMQVRAFDITEGRINKLVKQLSHLNEINKDLSNLTNALTRCKESGKADFSADPETQALIDRIFEINPKIFGNQKTYAWNSDKQIDVLLSSLDAEIKTKIAEVNQVTMFINVRFDERVQYSENSRKVMDMLIRHCESIISKYHK